MKQEKKGWKRRKKKEMGAKEKEFKMGVNVGKAEEEMNIERGKENKELWGYEGPKLDCQKRGKGTKVKKSYKEWNIEKNYVQTILYRL